jgi:uncharacterized membrane protein YhaH (DUF805 family)
MNLLALLFLAHGRIPPKPFSAGAAAVYAIALLSLLLLSRPALQLLGWLPFALVQAVTSWSWFCLHAKRLQDADRRIAPAAAIAALYVMAMVLLLLVIMLLPGGAQGGIGTSARSFDFLLPAFLTMLLGDASDLGLFDRVATAFLGLILAPIAIAVGFSIWAGSRPSVTSSSAAPP